MSVQKFFKSLISTSTGRLASRRPKSKRRLPRRRLRRPLLEALEDRVLLSTIHWFNEGPSDGFDAVYGNGAAAARNVVHAAFNTWASVISNFNYSDGTNTLEITLTTNTTPTTGLGSGSSTTLLDGKPKTGTINITGGTDGHGINYFIDSTPYDSSEFRETIVNAYVGDAPPPTVPSTNKASGLTDLYSLVLQETSHVLGFSKNPQLRIWTGGFMTNTDITIPQGLNDWGSDSNRNTYWVFRGADVNALFNGSSKAYIKANPQTGPYNAVHVSEPSTLGPINYAGLALYGARDSDDGFLANGRRYLPSYLDALLLKDAYGYTISPPSNNNMYINFDSATGNLLVRGGTPGEAKYAQQNNPSNDIIVLNTSQRNGVNFLDVSVTIGNPVPGTGPNSTYSTSFIASSVKRINVNAGDGDDIIDLNSLPAITVNVDGGTGNNRLRVNDGGLTVGGTYNVNSIAITRSDGLLVPYSNVNNRLQLNTGSGSDIINVEKTVRGVPLDVNAGRGSDTVYISRDAKLLGNIAGEVTVNGGGGNGFNDQLFINDQLNILGSTIEVTQNTVQELGTGLIRYNLFNGLTINGGSGSAGFGGNTFNVMSTDANPTTLNTGAGADTVSISKTTGPLTVNGESGLDTVNIGSGGSVQNIGNTLTVANPGGYSAVSVNDSADKKARTVILYKSGFYNVIAGLTPGVNIFLRGPDLSSLMIRAGDGGNTFRIHDTPSSITLSSLTTTVLTGAGNDNVTVDGTTGALDLNVQGGFYPYQSITIGSPAGGLLDFIQGKINISGPGGTYGVGIDDHLTTAGRILTHTITASSYQRTGAALINLRDASSYYSLSSFSLSAGSAADTINVQGRPGDSTSIAGGLGNDIINVGTAANQLAGIGTVNVDGGGGVDALNIYDQGSTTAQTYTLTSVPIFNKIFPVVTSADAALRYTTFENLSLYGGSGGNTVAITSIPAGTQTAVHAGANNDLVTVGNSLSGIKAPLSIDGQDGDDRLVLNDSAAASGQIYTILPGSVLASDAAQISFAALEHLDLTGTTFADFFQVGDATHSLDGLQPEVTLNGNGGIDQLKLDDTAALTGHIYNLHADDLQRYDLASVPDAGLISFGGMKTITLRGARGPANVLFAYGSPAGSTVDVYGAPGSQDTFALFPGFQPNLGPVRFHGQAADGDFAYYNDSVYTGTPQTYTVSVDPAFPTVQRVVRTGEAPVTYEGVYQVLLFTAVVGGNTVNVQGVAPGIALGLVVFSGDQVTIGSQAPNLGGSLANIQALVLISGAGATGPTVTVDDSADTTGRQVMIDPSPADYPTDTYTEMTGLAPAQILWDFTNGSGQVSVLGGRGNDSFVVHGVIPNVALSIDGGAGRDLLIAGGTEVALSGGAGEDILIGGWTDYDNDAAAIDAIMTEWSRTDIGYDTRVANLQSGANGVPALNATTVHSNGKANKLTGGTERDLFFASLASELLDWDPLTEQWIVIV